MEWISLIQTLGGIVGGIGIGAFTKAGRKRDRADADLKVQEAQAKMIENYEERIADLHKNIDRLNESEVKHSERIAQKDHELDAKTDQIRNLTQKMWESEQEVNRVQNLLNDALAQIAALTEERDEWKAVAEYYKQWQCHSSICVKGAPDPEGRRPPNPKLKGQKFSEPRPKKK